MEPQTPRLEELKKTFEQARESASATEVRAAALSYYRARAAQGGTQEEVSRELGLSRWTLAKWHQRPGRAQPEVRRAAEKPLAEPIHSGAVAALKLEIEGLGPRRPSRRFPAELKARIIEVVRSELERGVGSRAVEELLGIPWESLAKWLGRGERQGEAAARVRPIRVVGPAAFGVRSERRGPVLKCPGGFVVEGLDVAALAELLRRLS